MNPNSKQGEHHPLVAALLAAACFWGMHQLELISRAGNSLAVLGVLLLAYLGLKLSLQAVNAFDDWWERQRIQGASKKASDQQGAARWATLKDVRKAGMLKKGEGFFLGALKGKDLYYNGETSLTTIAPPGAGKTSCFIINNMFALMDQFSIFCLDLKLEIAAVTARYRKEVLGQEVVFLNPYPDKMAEELGQYFPDCGFNPMSFISRGAEARDDAELLAEHLLPAKPNMGGSSEYFTGFGRTILVVMMLYLISRVKDEFVNLVELRKLLFVSPDDFNEILVEMSESNAFGGAVRQYAAKLLGTSGPELSGGMSMAQHALRFYAEGPLADHVCKDGFDPRRLKNGMTAYLCMPTDRIASNQEHLSMVTGLSIELAARNRTSGNRCLFLLDEFPQTYLPNVIKAMGIYRAQGIQFWIVVQQISQLIEKYGDAGSRSILGMSDVVNTFGVFESQTTELISRMLGQSTVRSYSQGITPKSGGADFHFNYQASDQGVPLMRNEDVRMLPDDAQLIFYRNLPPIRAKKVPYYTRRQWRQHANSNPYVRNPK